MLNSVPNEITDNTLSLSTATGLSLFYRTALSCFNICDNNFIFINLDINEPIHHGCGIAILEKNILRYSLKFPWHQLIGKTLLPILILSTSFGFSLFLQKYFAIFSMSVTTIEIFLASSYQKCPLPILSISFIWLQLFFAEILWYFQCL